MTWKPTLYDDPRFSSIEKARMLFSQVKPRSFSSNKEVPIIQDDLPTSYDLVEMFPECVDHIYNQGSCGACWAFSAIGAFSDNRCIFKRDQQYIHYSEEYMAECDTQEAGCFGGYLDGAQLFLTLNGAIPYSCKQFVMGDGVNRPCTYSCDDGSPLPTAVY